MADPLELAKREVWLLMTALDNCEECRGEACVECDGEGARECVCDCGHQHDSDCSACGGVGRLPAKGKGEGPCADCVEARRRITALSHLYPGSRPEQKYSVR